MDYFGGGVEGMCVGSLVGGHGIVRRIKNNIVVRETELADPLVTHSCHSLQVQYMCAASHHVHLK